jgi:hypothetical protein
MATRSSSEKCFLASLQALRSSSRIWPHGRRSARLYGHQSRLDLANEGFTPGTARCHLQLFEQTFDLIVLGLKRIEKILFSGISLATQRFTHDLGGPFYQRIRTHIFISGVDRLYMMG